MVKPRIKREFEMWKVSRDGAYSYHCTLGEACRIARNIWIVSSQPINIRRPARYIARGWMAH